MLKKQPLEQFSSISSNFFFFLKKDSILVFFEMSIKQELIQEN